VGFIHPVNLDSPGVNYKKLFDCLLLGCARKVLGIYASRAQRVRKMRP
jgi:hypothetical protein